MRTNIVSVAAFIAALSAPLHANAQTAVSGDELISAFRACESHRFVPSRTDNIVYEPGWEHCLKIERVYQESATAVAERARVAKEAQDRQMSIDAAKKIDAADAAKKSK